MNAKILKRSLLIWAATIPLAVLNGALRELLFIPALGKLAFPLSGLLLSMMIYTIAFSLLPRLGAGKTDTYLKMGCLWVLCTVIFETLLGLISGDSWSVILDNYNLLTGNLWLLVVLFIGIVPYLVARARKLI